MRDLYLAAYDFEKEAVILKDIYCLAKILHQKNLLTEEEFAFFEKAGMKDREFPFYIPAHKDIEMSITKYFDIIDIFCNAEVDPELYPLYVLKLK